MDALGRGVAVMLSVIGIAFFSVLYKTDSAEIQKNETVRSMCHAYAEEIIAEKTVSQKEWELFQEQLDRIGTYRSELTIYEQKAYKGETGDVSLYTVHRDIKEDVYLLPGSYVRLMVTEDAKTKTSMFFRGVGCTVYTGGRIE